MESVHRLNREFATVPMQVPVDTGRQGFQVAVVRRLGQRTNIDESIESECNVREVNG